MSGAPIAGHVAPGWGAVHDAFAANFADHGDIGAAVAVAHAGRLVVDLHGGWFDAARTRPYEPGTLQLVFSATKGVTATAVAMCVERGWLDYDAPVARWWPEFAAHGKDRATVAQVLSHQVGVICPSGPLTREHVLDDRRIAASLADTAPAWPVGSTHGYHALTFGWMAGELVRRADPAGRSLGRFVAEEIAAPLGDEVWIGLPPEAQPRVSPVIAELDPAVRALVDQFLGPETLAGKAVTLGGVFPGLDAFNDSAVHAAEIPSANGITTARALARMYAATMTEVEGVRLVGDETMARARATVTPAGEPDACILMSTSFAMGYMTNSAFTPFAGAGSYGHPGLGGSVAFAQPSRQLAFAYVTNRMATALTGDERGRRLIAAAVAAADAT